MATATKNGVAKAAPASKKDPTVVKLPHIDLKRATLELVSTSSLIMHRWSDKAVTMMKAKQEGAAKVGRERRDPWMDFVESMYWASKRPDGVPTQEDVRSALFQFPATAFKAAAVDACTYVDGLTKVMTRGAFHIEGDMVPIICPDGPKMREDMVRVGMGTADLRYRGEFKNWSALIPILYNSRALSLAQIANLFRIAGFAVGVGEWRPQKDGSHGMFKLAGHIGTAEDDSNG